MKLFINYRKRKLDKQILKLLNEALHFNMILDGINAYDCLKRTYLQDKISMAIEKASYLIKKYNEI